MANEDNRKRFLVLGGCGFLGSVVTKRLVKNGWNVRVFDKEGTDQSRLKTVLPKIELVYGDFMNAGDLQRALEGVSTVLHFIGTTIPQTSMQDIDFDIQTNVLGTVRLLELTRAMKVERFIFSSSGGTVYGVPEEFRPLRETDRTEPISAYGVSKLTVEKYIQLFSVNYRLPAIIFRFSNPYGPSQSVNRQQGAASVFVDKALRGEELSIWGDGTVVRDYLYEEDLADAVESVLHHPDAGGVMNVGTGIGTSLNQLRGLVEQSLSLTMKVNYLPSRSFDVPYNVLDCTKIQRATGWKPRHSLQDGIRIMAEKFRGSS